MTTTSTSDNPPSNDYGEGIDPSGVTLTVALRDVLFFVVALLLCILSLAVIQYKINKKKFQENAKQIKKSQLSAPMELSPVFSTSGKDGCPSDDSRNEEFLNDAEVNDLSDMVVYDKNARFSEGSPQVQPKQKQFSVRFETDEFVIRGSIDTGDAINAQPIQCSSKDVTPGQGDSHTDDAQAHVVAVSPKVVQDSLFLSPQFEKTLSLDAEELYDESLKDKDGSSTLDTHRINKWIKVINQD